jgi:hypothetical protein
MEEEKIARVYSVNKTIHGDLYLSIMRDIVANDAPEN